VSYWRLADLAEQQKNGSEANSYWKQAFDVLVGIEQRGVCTSRQKTGSFWKLCARKSVLLLVDPFD